MQKSDSYFVRGTTKSQRGEGIALVGERKREKSKATSTVMLKKKKVA